MSGLKSYGRLRRSHFLDWVDVSDWANNVPNDPEGPQSLETRTVLCLVTKEPKGLRIWSHWFITGESPELQPQSSIRHSMVIWLRVLGFFLHNWHSLRFDLSPTESSWSRYQTTRQNRRSIGRGVQRSQGGGQAGHLSPQGSHTGEGVAPRSDYLWKQVSFEGSKKCHLPSAFARRRGFLGGPTSTVLETEQPWWQFSRMRSWMKWKATCQG